MAAAYKLRAHRPITSFLAGEDMARVIYVYNDSGGMLAVERILGGPERVPKRRDSI